MKIFDNPDFRNLPPEIMSPFVAAGDRGFFNLPQWFGLIADCRVEGEPAIAGVAIDESSGIAIVYGKTSNAMELNSLTNLYTCSYDILGGGAGHDAVAAFAKAFASSLPPGGRIHLQGFDRTNLAFGALLSGCRAAGLVAKPHFAWGSWYESTGGLDFESYLARRPSILRNTWRRKRTALQRQAKVELRVYRNGDDVGRYIEAYESVQQRSWKAAEPFRQFIPQLVRLASQCGALRFGVLEIDNAPAAAQFWIVWGGKATIFKLAHVKEFGALSPGTYLTMEMFRHVLENDRPSEIDFGRGDDDYKKLWLGSRREHWGIEAVSPRTPRGLARAAWLGLGLGRDYLRGKIA
jgi:hypothetical protein